MDMNKTNIVILDKEWMQLIFEAKKLGLTIEEIKKYLKI